jgi:ubiquinone/menaquinone biosynthesis C-methylase UbiE
VTFLLSGRARRVVGADVSLENVRRARDNLRRRSVSNGLVVQGSVERLPFADRTFSIVVLADVIEHVPDVAGCLKEIRRVLEPNGRLICVTPIRGTIAAWRVVDALVRVLIRPRSMRRPAHEGADVYERFLTGSEMRAALRTAKLRPIRTRRICFYPAPETTGAFGALMRGIHERVRARSFARLSAATIGVFDAIAVVGLMNQKQLWVAVR